MKECKNKVKYKIALEGDKYLCSKHFDKYRNYIYVSEEIPIIIAKKSSVNRVCDWR